MISENSYCDEGPVTSGKFLTSAAADASLSYGSWSPSPFLTVVSLGLLGQLGLVDVVLALGHGPGGVDVDGVARTR